MLNRSVKFRINSSAQSLRILVGIPSGPGALVGSRFFSALRTSDSLIWMSFRLASSVGGQCGMVGRVHLEKMLLKNLLKTADLEDGSVCSTPASIRWPGVDLFLVREASRFQNFFGCVIIFSEILWRKSLYLEETRFVSLFLIVL